MTQQWFPKKLNIYEKKLKNGSCHFHIEAKNANHFFIGIYVKAGSRFEKKEEAGISHFLEHMMFRGSKENPSFLDLAQKFEAFGGEWNAATGHEHTEYTYLGLSDASIPITQLFGELLANPLLLNPEKEKQIILREIEDEMNEFDEFLDLDFHSGKLIWKEEGFQSPITGEKTTVVNLGIEHLRAYHSLHYVAENIIICTFGSVDREEIQKTVEDSFHFPQRKNDEFQLKKEEEKKSSELPLLKFVKNTDNQYQVQLNFLAKGEWSNKTSFHALICHILANGFSSRLSKSLREEKGLVYNVSSYLSSFVDRGFLSINYACTKEHFFLAFLELLLVLKGLKENGITEEELIRAKRQETLESINLIHDPEAYSFYLARHKHWNKELDMEASFKEIESIQKENIQQEIKDLFQASKTLLVVMGGEELKWEKECKKLIIEYLS